MINKSNKKNKIKDNNIIICSVVIGIIICWYLNGTNGQSVESANEIQEGLASSLLRFHVIANSDSDEDQQLKLVVRDEVLDFMSTLLEGVDSKEESKKIITDNEEEISAVISKVIKDEGFDYEFRMAIEDTYFPTKSYGDIVLPTGVYEAFKIEIGNSNGKNWWCVMFPPLCFVDVTHGVVEDESKEDLKTVLTDEEYNSILMNEEDKDYKIKFKIADIFKEKEEKQEERTGIIAFLFGK